MATQMPSFIQIPIEAVIQLSPERAVGVARAILRSECTYARISPASLTISGGISTSDGGIDAEINAPHGSRIPHDCLFQTGKSGFQIKSGSSFKPWTDNAIRKELLTKDGNLHKEVENLLRSNGKYYLICTGHDFTPEQRNKAHSIIIDVFKNSGFTVGIDSVDVFGARQIVEFAERYPGTASLLAADQIHEGWTFDVWQRDSHMGNAFEASAEQTQIIERIRTGLRGETKHIRVLGEPGLGKTRIVLESLRDESLSPTALYIPNGSSFGQTKLFRQILKHGHCKPLILVLDDLQESELVEIWRHIKPICEYLKIISMDHNQDETHDGTIDRIYAPRLPDTTIKHIMTLGFNETHDLDRWVEICEGSPRVALAVAENLQANPDDILKPPSTVHLWDRFVHGHGDRDDTSARQLDCVTQHLALFCRFGFEDPVGNEAKYIAELISLMDPTIGWARFQEIIKALRSRRILQGSHTLFFVPKALHIYLWKRYWAQYGRGFNFTHVMSTMPESLHAWFMGMFKYAGETKAQKIVSEILNPSGIFSDKSTMTSNKGSHFLYILAEADPPGVLRLLETTIGTWSDEELFSFKHDRQWIVWALERIAVWPQYTCRSIALLSLLAINENADNSNNSTGTLIGLFRLGPEHAATESSPEAKLPALLAILRSDDDRMRLLGLKAIKSSLNTTRLGFRIVGPEYQGLKKRAKLWRPNTYDEWQMAYKLYFDALVTETDTWPTNLRQNVIITLIDVINHQLTTPLCTELALKMIERIAKDQATPPSKLNSFFWNWQTYVRGDEHLEIAKRLRRIERAYTKRSLASRFQRYVIDVEWEEWDDELRERRNKPATRAKYLVRALAHRIANHNTLFCEVQHQLTPEKHSIALWYFGNNLARYDKKHIFLNQLTKISLDAKHSVCIRGYMEFLKDIDPPAYKHNVALLLKRRDTAWLGASIALCSSYDDELFKLCLDALKSRWTSNTQFYHFITGSKITSIPEKRLNHLTALLYEINNDDSIDMLLNIFDLFILEDCTIFSSEFVFNTILKFIPKEAERELRNGHTWKNICGKLIAWDTRYRVPLLDNLIIAMDSNFRLCYDRYAKQIADELVASDPTAAWDLIQKHLESKLPNINHGLIHWLLGEHPGFNETEPYGAIKNLPQQRIAEWIEVDPSARAPLIASAAPPTIDTNHGGWLTAYLIGKHSTIPGVLSRINATFRSGGWSGPASAYYRRKRDKLRHWLTIDYDINVIRWIENEIAYFDQVITREEINEEREYFD